MGRVWTPEQQAAITLRKRNLLVSAGAGSGKTAVLSARILDRLTDPEKSTDITSLLIVTFTKAAAAELRERILREIYARDRKSTRLNSSHSAKSRMPSSA